MSILQLLFFKLYTMKEKTNEALIIVDYQNDFAHPEGSLYVPDWEIILPFINNMISEIKNKSGLIVSSQDWHPINHTSFAKNHNLDDFSMKDWEMKWPIHCVENSWWADFLDWLDTEKIDKKIKKWFEEDKECYSSFGWVDFESGESLDEILKKKGIEILHILWLATDYCDLATIKDALKKWYKVNAYTKWMKAVNAKPWDWKRALEEMRSLWAKILT